MTQERKDLERVLLQLERTIRSNMGGNMVGRVVRVNQTTIDVQPVINKKINGQSVKFPVLAQVPPIFLSGGSSHETWPISVGDYCLLIISENCFDSWYSGLDSSDPIEDRRFDYSDMFAIVGLYNSQGALDIPAIITRQGDSTHTGDHEHVGDTTQTGDKTQTGNYSLDGLLTLTNTTGTASTTSGTIEHTGTIDVTGLFSYDNIETIGLPGVSGSFTSQDGKTITVTNGIITGIV